MKRLRPVVMLMALILVVGVFAFAADEPLLIGTTDRVTELSFANCYDHFTWHVLRNCTDALTKFDTETGEFVGAIAESWDVSEDGLIWVFHIRPGITFWDGAVCDAAAVKYSLERT